MWRNLFALVSGVFGAMIVITFIELIGAKLYRAPPGFDFKDPAAVAAFVHSMPLSAELLIVSAWCLGGFAGAFVAARLALGYKTALAMLIGVLIAVGTLANAQSIPHPTWMVVAGVIGPVLLAWLAQWLVQKRQNQNGLASTR
ncbi:hypothetical protein [Arenimonas oryziterrae]|uniref:Uncharacterized protein n=1 Tax=Arenimonas oryziterrae DSM 21050 = YC6267 TaxID=1121015 RepID=A0A091AZG0_9GAMM|nr:hypothetical protein [Arenimonas oryziterrae]KFN44831.1 hypothetical protein N789_02105 [Arenimonas oryziterrae DSM 21050 = YC6267]